MVTTFQSMPKTEGLTEIGDLRQAKNCVEPNVRFVLQQRKLTSLPKGIEHIAHIPRVELDLSYNKTLEHEALFQELASFKNLRGLGLIKNEMGTLPGSIGQLGQLEVLELWSNGLKSLPDTFRNLQNLEYLNLRNNNLTQLPDYFRHFKKLRSLNLQYNKIKHLPGFLFELTHLEYLNVATCGLTEIPVEIGNLTNLKTLVVSKNDLKKLPLEIRNLKQLETLAFDGNNELDLEQLFELFAELPAMQALDLSKYQLKALPESIGKMKQLRCIHLRENKLEALPAGFADLALEEMTLDSNPWNMEKLFPVLAQVQVYKQMYSSSFPAMQQKKEVQLPASIGQFQYLEEIYLSGESLKSIPITIGQLAKLKTFSLAHAGLETLPSTIGNMRGLEYLSIQNCPNLKDLPGSLYELPGLKSLNFTHNGCQLDFEKLQGLPALERLSVEEPTDELFRWLKPIKTLKAVLFPWQQVLKRLPDSFFELEQLEHLSITFQDFDEKHFLKQLPRLKNLRELAFNCGPDIEFEDILNSVLQLPFLRALTTNTYKPIPPVLLKLAHLESLSLNISTSLSFQQLIPQEYAWFPEGILNIHRFKHSLKKLDELKGFLKEKIGPQHPQFLLFINLLQRDFAAAKGLMENPFDQQGKLPGVCVYITAKPSAGTLKALQENLSARGATISKTLDEKVTHLFLTPNISDEMLPQLVGDYQFILEDHLRERELAEDTPYLMEQANAELAEQVTQLLKSEQTDQTTLLLELIEGGGATPKIVSYLGAIHLFHNNTEVRKKARNLFRKYAGSSLQEHVKKYWKDSFRDKDIDYFKHLLQHPDWDSGAFIHAWKMVLWHRMPATGKANDYDVQRFWSLYFHTLPAEYITPSFLDFEYIYGLNGQVNGNLDWDLMEEIVVQRRVAHFAIRAFMPKMPARLFAAPGLQKFSAGNWEKNSNFDFSKIPAQNSGLTELALHNCRITHARQFDKFPHLEKLSLNNCTIDHADGIANLTALKSLTLANTEIAVFGSAFERLTQLEELRLTQNNLQQVDLNFSKLQNLKWMQIEGNLITSLPDTFVGCRQLETVNVNQNQLESLPPSLFRIPSAHIYPKLKIHAQKNRIQQLGTVGGVQQRTSLFNKMFGGKTENAGGTWGNIDSLDVTDNHLSSVPEVLFLLQKINKVQLEGNPITYIPADAAWDGRIVGISIGGDQLSEVPAAIFGKKTKLSIYIRREDCRLPAPEALPEFDNVYLSAHYQASEELKQRVSLTMTKRRADF